MIDALLRDFRQPEYLHVLINPLPVYGLAMGLIGLIVAFFLKSRPAQIVALIIILISAATALPVYLLGEQAYDRVLSMSDEAGHAWLNEHQDRGEDAAPDAQRAFVAGPPLQLARRVPEPPDLPSAASFACAVRPEPRGPALPR